VNNFNLHTLSTTTIQRRGQMEGKGRALGNINVDVDENSGYFRIIVFQFKES
jgi:hypothetical protein